MKNNLHSQSLGDTVSIHKYTVRALRQLLNRYTYIHKYIHTHKHTPKKETTHSQGLGDAVSIHQYIVRALRQLLNRNNHGLFC
jgi:hypothetical protein